MPSPGGGHNVGDIAFAPDGTLIVSIGDGSCDLTDATRCGPQNGNARRMNLLLGKILRITSSGGIPADNPYQGTGTARCNVNGRASAGTICREIYATGFRNPFRFAVDPNSSGLRIHADDTGQNTWEEVNDVRPGRDYGWNVCEGRFQNGSTSVDCSLAGATDPIFSYGHGGCNAITGAAFVPAGIWPSAYDGKYLFGDYTCDRIWVLNKSGNSYSRTDFATGVDLISMAFGPSGSTQALYYTTLAGQVRKIQYTGSVNRPPEAKATASPMFGTLPLTVTFDGSGSSDPDRNTLTYDWDFGDGSVHGTGAKPQHTYTAKKVYTVTLRVNDGRGGTDTTTLRIDAGNTQPQPTILNPTASETFAVGETITLQGSATDSTAYGTTDGPAVYTSSSLWNERTITWDNRPVRSTTPVDDKGSLAQGTWVEYDVTVFVTGNGKVTLVLAGSSTDVVVFSSREGATPPELVVVAAVSGGASVMEVEEPPVPTATAEPTRTPEPTRTLEPTVEPEPTEEIAPTETATQEASPSPTAEVEPTAVPELPLEDGFESGDLAGWTEVEGLTVQQAVVSDGSWAARATSAGSSGSPGEAAFGRRTVGEAQDELFVAFDVNVMSLGDEPVTLLQMQASEGRPVLTLVVSEGGELAIRAGRSSRQLTVGTVTLGEWHHVQVHTRADGTDGRVAVWLDGEAIYDNRARVGDAGIVAVQIGETATDRSFDIAFDAFAVDRACIGSCPAVVEVNEEPTRERRPRVSEPAETPGKEEEATATPDVPEATATPESTAPVETTEEETAQ